MRSIVAALAQAALANGPNSAQSSAGWHYDETEVPTASYISRLIKGLERDEIVQIFMDVNRRFVELASEYGFFDREYDYALNATWITWGGEGTPDDSNMILISNPEECSTGKGWCFTRLIVTDIDARFALGLNLAPDKNHRTGQFRRMLLIAAQEGGGVGRAHIDR